MFKLKTIDLYLSRNFLRYLMLATLIIGGLIGIIDLTELLRRTYHKHVSFDIVMQMTLLKLPAIISEMLPFIVLIAAMITADHISKNQEFIALRSFRCSVLRIARPIIICVLLLSVSVVLVFDEIASNSLNLYKELEQQYIGKDTQLTATLSQGVWLKDELPSGDKAIFFTPLMSVATNELSTPTVLIFNNKHEFNKALFAKSATIVDGNWQIYQSMSFTGDSLPNQLPQFTIPTTIDLTTIEYKFSATINIVVMATSQLYYAITTCWL